MSGSYSHQLRVFFPFLFLLGILLPTAGCDDDDPVGPFTGPDIGGVVRDENGSPAAGTTVYLGRDPEWMSAAATVVVDSVLADAAGRFQFDQLDRAAYRVFGGVWDPGGDGYSRVSPFSGPLDVGAKASGRNVCLSLVEMDTRGTAAGEVYFEGGPGLVPADSAKVNLNLYAGADFVKAGEAFTKAGGAFSLAGVRTGNYTARAIWTSFSEAPFPLFMSAESEPFFCDGQDLVVLDRLILRELPVEKPAIYIYPARPGNFQVGLELGPGIRLTASEPEYGAGWDVEVDAAGRIDGTWDYLFYEIAMRGEPRIPVGWCLDGSELTLQLEELTTSVGLLAAEKDDFIAYWESRLPHRPYYEVNPVWGEDLEAWVKLKVVPAPDSVLRFWLFFRGSDVPAAVAPPVIPAFERRGTTVVEWGGAVRS